VVTRSRGENDPIVKQAKGKMIQDGKAYPRRGVHPSPPTKKREGRKPLLSREKLGGQGPPTIIKTTAEEVIYPWGDSGVGSKTQKKGEDEKGHRAGSNPRKKKKKEMAKPTVRSKTR